jgi:hypothetical protein
MWITWRTSGTAWVTARPSLRRGAVFAPEGGLGTPRRQFSRAELIRRNRPQRKPWPVTPLAGMLHIERTISAIYLGQAAAYVWDSLV